MSTPSVHSPFPHVTNHQKEIDGLRAIAVLAVIVHHLSALTLPAGYLGVDVFFVISGYVITGSLVKRRPESLREFIGSFYERRIKRLLPALVVCVGVTALAFVVFNPAPNASLKTGLSALVGLSNLHLTLEATDYFGAAASLNAFTQTWSLGVEEQFYLVYPLLFWALYVRTRERRRAARFVAALVALGVASLAAFVMLYGTSRPIAYFSMPTRFWELVAGAVLFLALHRREERRDLPGAAMLSALALALMGASFLAPKTLAVPATIASVAATLLLIATARPGTLAHAFLTRRTMVWIGLISYSLYLWHWSVIAVARYTIGLHAWAIPLLVTLMFALALASYHWVERPLRAATWHPRRGRTFAYGFAATAAVATMIFLIAEPLNGRLYAGRRPQLEAEGIESLAAPVRDREDGSVWSGESCVLAEDADRGKPIVVQDCTFGDPATAKQRILVVGNSYAAAFVPAFAALAEEHDLAITVTSAWAASPVPQLPNTTPWADANEYYWDEVVPAQVAQLEAGDLVFLVHHLAGLSPAVRSEESEQRLELFAHGIDSIASDLADHDVKFAMLNALPFTREANCTPAQAVPQWFAPNGGPCNYYSREETYDRLAPLDSVLDQLADSSDLMIVDALPLFCPSEVCTYLAANGTLLYRDEYAHPSVESARMATDIFERQLHLRAPSPVDRDGRVIKH